MIIVVYMYCMIVFLLMSDSLFRFMLELSSAQPPMKETDDNKKEQ